MLSATAADRFGNEIANAGLGWRVLGRAGGVDETGLFTAGTEAGTYQGLIEATMTHLGSSAAALIDVIITPGRLASVEVTTPGSLDGVPFLNIGVGGTEPLSFSPADEFGNEISDVRSTWTVDPEAGRIDSNGILSGGTKAGWFLGAILLEVVTGSETATAAADILVWPGPLAAVEIQPDSAVLSAGDVLQFGAKGHDSYGNEIRPYNRPGPGPQLAVPTDLLLEFVWDTTGGSIDSTGKFITPEQLGRYEVTASAGYIGGRGTGSATVDVPPFWVPAGDLARSRGNHAAVLLEDGNVFIVGWDNTAVLYDSASRRFKPLGRTPCAHRKDPTATLLGDGTVLIAGGNGQQECADIFHPGTGSFSRIADMNAGHWEHTATLLPDGRVLLAGGKQPVDGGFVSHAIAEIYDPQEESFSLTGMLNRERVAHSATLLPSGQVLITAGVGINQDEREKILELVCLNDAELYDPITGTFRSAGNLLFNGCDLVATPLYDGNVLITRDEQAELYDLAVEAFRPAGIMTGSRDQPTATLLPTGHVLITGGWENDTATAEIYDPATRTFSATENMLEGRQYHTATLLPDGQVLVVGGFGARELVDSAELYVPGDLPDRTVLSTEVEPGAAPPARILFNGLRDGDWEIYSIKADGTDLRQLTSNEARDFSPSWSPDGERIALFSDRDGDFEIYIMDADGTNVVQITTNEVDDLNPWWSPNSNKIVFVRRQGEDEEIYVMDADGTNVEQLTFLLARDRNPRWSPKGDRIVYQSDRGSQGDWELFSVEIDGGNLRQLTSNEVTDHDARWSPDGEEIAFLSAPDGDLEVYVMDANGGNKRRLTDAVSGARNHRWSPDGQRIAFDSIWGEQDIYVVDTDGSNLTRLTFNPESTEGRPWGQPLKKPAGAPLNLG